MVAWDLPEIYTQSPRAVLLHVSHSHFCMYHTMHTLTVCVIFITLRLLHMLYFTHLLCISHFCMYYTMHAYCVFHISVHITLHLLYMSHFCTTLTVHVTFLYYAYCTCHISVLCLLYMSHFCTTLTVHVTFLYYTYCTRHISALCVCLLCMSYLYFCMYHTMLTMIIYFLFSNLGGKGCSSPVRNCSFKAIMLVLFRIGWPTSLYTLFQKISMVSATCDILLQNKLCIITVVKNFNVTCVYVKFKHFHEPYIIHLFANLLCTV